MVRDPCLDCQFPPCRCGGIAGDPCDKGETCVDIPNDGCDPAKGDTDCAGACAPCKEFCFPDVKECPDGTTKVSRDPCNNCEFAPCPPPPSCSGPCPADAMLCPDGTVVERDPCNNCEFAPCPPPPSCPGPCTADAMLCPDGTAVGRDACNDCKFLPCPCGGIAGFPCPEGEECVDDPSDNCDPEQGGADCHGICVGE